MMATWETIYNKLKENVKDKLQKEELKEGSINFERLLGNIIKECLFEEGILKRKEVGADKTRNIPGKNVLYRDDSIIKLATVKI